MITTLMEPAYSPLISYSRCYSLALLCLAPAAAGQERPVAPAAVELQRQSAPSKITGGLEAFTTLYTFGNPSADEQMQLELLNRARANPAAEGLILAALTDPTVVDYATYYGVNMTIMKTELAALPALPPLAPNQQLTNAARSHSQWMLTTGQQEHDEIPNAPGGNATERITAAGYAWTSTGENLYAYSASALFAHAGFEIDWGPAPNATYGMQNPRGHRNNNHTSSFREVGIGIVYGSAFNFGPQILTESFGQSVSSPVFITGVAYYDLNGNNFYDLGEGVSGLTISSVGSSYHAVSAAGGGWVLPFPRAGGAQTILFTGPNLAQSKSTSINAALDNVKLDLKLTYTIPTITSPSTGALGLPVNTTFTPVPGVGSYRVTSYSTAAAPAENCENATKVTATLSDGYALVDPNVRQQGVASFHLAMPDGEEQVVQLNTLYSANAAPTIIFQSRLGYATGDQTALVEFKEEGTSNWVTVYSQSGSDTQGEISWKVRAPTLSAWAGKLFRMRLRYAIASGGAYYSDVDNTTGWFVDAIQFTNISALTPVNIATVSAPASTFTPATVGTYIVRVEPLMGTTSFPAARQSLTVTAPAGMLAWAVSYEQATGLAPGTIALNPLADYDRDGLENLCEYAFGSSPTQPTPASARRPQFRCTANAAQFDYVVDISLTDLTLRPEISLNFHAWKSPGQAGAPVGYTDTLLSTNGTLQTRRASLPMAGAAKAFFRLTMQLK